MLTLPQSLHPALAEHLGALVARFASDQVFFVGGDDLAADLHDRCPGIVMLDNSRAHHPGRGTQALRDLLPTFGARSMFVLAGNGLDTAYVRHCLHLLPRGAGTLLVGLGRPAGPVGPADLRDQLLLWDPDHQCELVQASEGDWLLVRPRRNVHVTLLMERYSHTYGTSGPSVNWDNLYCSLEQTGLASVSTVLYDDYHHQQRAFTAADFRRPPGVDEHALVCIYDHTNGHNPPVALLEQARRSGTKIAYVWLDTRILVHDAAYPAAADVNVLLDATEFDLPNAWPVFTPKNPAWFHDPGRLDVEWQRPIDVSVLGEMRFLRQRKDLLPRLQQERRLRIHAPGSSATDVARRLTNEQYARVFQQSKISLALSKDRVRQLKGRLLEIPLCGAMLLADINPYIDRYFTPFREYVPFRDYEDLIDLCRYYLDHEDERAAIALAGSRKANRFYSAQVFWQSLFARLFDRASAHP